MHFFEVAVSEVESHLVNFANVTRVYQTLQGSAICFVDGSKLFVIHSAADLFKLLKETAVA